MESSRQMTKGGVIGIMDLTTQQAADELKKRIYYEPQPGGGIIAYDMLTGAVVGRSSSLQELMGGDTTHRSYHPAIVDKMCDVMVDEGVTLSQVCRRDNYPSLSTVMRWCRVYPEISAKLDEARAMQAEGFYDEIVSGVDVSDLNRDEVAVEKLRFEKLKYLAGVSNPTRYGNRTIHSGDEKAPVQFVISTGINREQPGVVDEAGTGVEREERVGSIEYNGED